MSSYGAFRLESTISISENFTAPTGNKTEQNDLYFADEYLHTADGGMHSHNEAMAWCMKVRQENKDIKKKENTFKQQRMEKNSTHHCGLLKTD